MNRVCNDECDKAMDPMVKCAMCDMNCHISCYGIGKTVHRAIGESNNLWFLCDECSEKKSAFFATQNKVASTDNNNDIATIFQAIGELKNMFMDMQVKMNNIEKPTFRNILGSETQTSNSSAAHGNSRRKRMRFADNTANLYETPTTRPKTSVIGNNKNEKALTSVEPRKWVFVSQLHPSTSDDAFVQYVKKQLKDDDNKLKVQAFALVPKERSRESLNFISFKLSIPESSLSDVLKPEIWPSGVVVREFVDDGRRRRQTGHFLPKTPLLELLG